VWLACVAAPVVAGSVAPFGAAIFLGLWRYFTGAKGGDGLPRTLFEVIFVLTALFFMPLLWTAILRMSLRLSPLPIARRSSFQLAPILWLSWLLVLGTFLASGTSRETTLVTWVVGLCCMGRVYYFRHHWQGFPSGPIVLFLRRFGRTADRIVSTAVRRAIPEGAHLALLMGSRQGFASWDPAVVSFDGMTTGGMPHYLQSTDEEWTRHVAEMVRRADAIVLDATDWSEAMKTELAIVEECGASDRLIVLERIGRTAVPDIRAADRVSYRASWRQAHDRMFYGFFLTFLPAVFGETVGWSIQTRWIVSIPAVLLWMLLAVRPMMDAPAAAKLTERLATLCHRNRFS
jgi:hypothetical protein